MRDGCADRGKKSMLAKMQNVLLFRISNFVSRSYYIIIQVNLDDRLN